MSIDTSTFDSLASAQYASLTTFRQNGIAVPTPIWFAMYEPTGTIYIETGATSGKVKRIRHTSCVTLAQCTSRGKIIGESIEGRARLVTTTEEIFIAKGALHHKYGFKRQAFYFVMYFLGTLRRTAEMQHGYLAIEPATK